MLFPNLIHISPKDLVLEIGPGAYPYWRADCLADKFDPNDDTVDIKQFGGQKMKLLNKPLFAMVDNLLPFKNNSFDYIVCAHVLEHVPYQELQQLINEINRVATRKYIEFPTTIYDLIYNFNVHENFMDIVGDTIVCLPKHFTTINSLAPFHKYSMQLRKLSKGIEQFNYNIFNVGKEFDGDLILKICQNQDEFFEEINKKYVLKIENNLPSFPYKVALFFRKKIRLYFYKEKSKVYFKNKIN